MVWRTISVHQEVYNIVKDKQNEIIKKKGGKNVELSYVTESAILLGIDKVE